MVQFQISEWPSQDLKSKGCDKIKIQWKSGYSCICAPNYACFWLVAKMYFRHINIIGYLQSWNDKILNWNIFFQKYISILGFELPISILWKECFRIKDFNSRILWKCSNLNSLASGVWDPGEEFRPQTMSFSPPPRSRLPSTHMKYLDINLIHSQLGIFVPIWTGL